MEVWHWINLIRERELRYRAFANQVGYSFLAHGLDGSIVEVSTRTPELLGYSKKNYCV
jgi:PAS domain S-box-containing protein